MNPHHTAWCVIGSTGYSCMILAGNFVGSDLRWLSTSNFDEVAATVGNRRA